MRLLAQTINDDPSPYRLIAHCDELIYLSVAVTTNIVCVAICPASSTLSIVANYLLTDVADNGEGSRSSLKTTEAAKITPPWPIGYGNDRQMTQTLLYLLHYYCHIPCYGVDSDIIDRYLLEQEIIEESPAIPEYLAAILALSLARSLVGTNKAVGTPSSSLDTLIVPRYVDEPTRLLVVTHNHLTDALTPTTIADNNVGTTVGNCSYYRVPTDLQADYYTLLNASK